MRLRRFPLPLFGVATGVACRSHQLDPPAKFTAHPLKGGRAWSRSPLGDRTGDTLRLRAGADEPPVNRDTLLLSAKHAAALGCVLALNSGVVNGACLSGLLHPDVKQASAAVTGAWTNSALGAAARDGGSFAFQGKCVVSYFAGSLIAGLLNPNPTPFEIHVPTTTITLLVGSALLLLSYFSAGSSDFIFYAAVACGLQNSLTSTATANLVRSAHFSGITSDMGTFLGQVLRGNKQNLLKLKVFFALAASFWTGGYVSYGLVKNLGKKVLLYGSMLYFVLGVHGAGFVAGDGSRYATALTCVLIGALIGTYG